MPIPIILIVILLFAGFGYYMLRNLAQDRNSRGLRYLAEIYLFLSLSTFFVIFLWTRDYELLN